VKWDEAFWPEKEDTKQTEPFWADEQTMKRVELNFQGSGETLALEMAHRPGATNSEPIGVCQITAEIAGIGKDTGDASET
jgi:hypothetical protein